MQKTLLCALLLLSSGGLFSQKMLLLERANRARPTKFFVGQDITYRLKDKDLQFWQDAVITEIFPEEKSIGLNGRKIALDQIEALRLRRSPLFRGIGTQLVVFGGAWLAFSGVHYAREKEPLDGTDFAIVGGSVATGLAMRKFFRHKTCRIGGKYRLRTIEISFERS